jgi:branched-chain amino acid transport system substrate-binding protein
MAGLLLISSCQKVEPPIKIGFLGCLTGRSADLGVAGRDGFLLAIDEMNAVGGINGRKIIPVVRDDALDSEKAKLAAIELLAESVSFIVGPMTSQMAMTVVPAVNAAKVPLISPTVSTNQLIGLDDYFFRVYYANSQAAMAMADHVMKSGLKKVVAL